MAPGADIGMEFSFSAALVEWRGPAPYHFLPLPEGASEAIGEVAGALTYGWGVIPVTATIGRTRFSTSLFPRKGGYLLPVKDAVRSAEGIRPGEPVAVTVAVGTQA